MEYSTRKLQERRYVKGSELEVIYLQKTILVKLWAEKQWWTIREADELSER